MITCTFEDGGKGKLRHVVVHGFVEKDNSILLVKRAMRFSEGGKWSLPSGFLWRDETTQECVVREILEETGWTCRVVSLFRLNSKPDRPHEDRQNVSFEYILKPLKKTGTPDDENTDIAWIPIPKLPPLSSLAFDHGESLGKYLKFRNSPFPLPLID